VIRLRTKTAAIRFSALLVVAATVSGCGQDNGTDFCMNHYAYHSDHLDSVASLTIKLSDVGVLDGKLSIPNFDDSGMLGDPNKAFSLQTEVPCELEVASISAAGEGIDVTYLANCGPDNQVGQIDVMLFDHIAALEEVVVSITTSATSKRFGISRQCDGPIFRLD
jgi:hypothetical protein